MRPPWKHTAQLTCTHQPSLLSAEARMPVPGLRGALPQRPVMLVSALNGLQPDSLKCRRAPWPGQQLPLGPTAQLSTQNPQGGSIQGLAHATPGPVVENFQASCACLAVFLQPYISEFCRQRAQSARQSWGGLGCVKLDL